MLLEFLLNLTFGVHQTFFWSFYPLAAGVLLGVMLIIIAVCPPLRRLPSPEVLPVNSPQRVLWT